MTIWAAKAAFDENEKGSLEMGKAADYVILNQDIMTVSEDKILETKVLETYSNGNQMYEDPMQKLQKKEAAAKLKK